MIKPSDPENLIKSKNTDGSKHRNRDCGAQVLDFFRDSLHKFYYLRWDGLCCSDAPKKQYPSSVFHDTEGVQLSDKVGGDNPRIFSFAELYIGSKGFSKDGILGSGGFGKVYRAVLPSDGTVVAVKCLVERGERFEKTLMAELVAVAHLRHKNLVRLRGWCVHEDQLFLVYDYMPNRSLDRVLFTKPNDSGSAHLKWERRRTIVCGLAQALFYLHEQLETQIIHRDVKTSNVMLDSNYNARLGDFGLARWLEHELEYQVTSSSSSLGNHQFRLVETSKIGGTIGYLPPESFQRRSISTSKSDVFSFGIVVLEVVSGRRSVDLTYPDDQIVLLDWIRRLSDEGQLLLAGDVRLSDESYMLFEMENLIHLGLLCTLHSPQSRPSMKWVVDTLSGNIIGKLPSLPSFQSHPRYISLSSPSNTTTSNTATTKSTSSKTDTASSSFTSTNYITAIGETIYATAEYKNSHLNSSKTESFNYRTTFPMMETPREIAFKEIVHATNNFSESQRVAELDFGTGYHGLLNDRQRILVKRLGLKTCPALRERFANELQNLGRLRHRNLVQLRGWCTEQGEMLVVYDYSTNRLLSHLLNFHHNFQKGHSALKWSHRYNIIKSLASAILYLHEEWEEQVIHKNITSSSVIIDPDLNPRLGSFALAEFLARNEHGPHVIKKIRRKSVRGIFGYMSPEYIESGEPTPESDIYSFGVVVLEMVSGQMAVDFRRPEVLLVKRVHEFEVRGRPLEELVDIRLGGEYDDKEVMRSIKLGIACTRSNPEFRPRMRKIVSILDGNDNCFTEKGKVGGSEDWKQRNATSLSLIKRIQALGIQ